MLKICFFALISFSLVSFACAEKLNHKEISMTFMARHISVSINRSAAQVYEFASNPENLPKWASGLSGSIKKVNEDWIAESPMGTVKVKFAEKNKFGVLDHDVILPSGVKVYNPMRVFPNNDGSELVFTLYRRPGVSGQEFAEDTKSIEKNLAKLKTLLEK
jgi:Polyketide cyclase / dehydrase and lipid transport